MIAPDMNRLFFVMLVFFLGGCGALSPSASQSEDAGRRLVGDSEGFSAGGLDADSVESNPADDEDTAATDEPVKEIREIVALKERGWIYPGVLKSHDMDFTEAQEAFEMYRLREDGVIKIAMSV